MPPRLARLLAAVVAIALVAGAFAVRSTLSDDEDATTGRDPRDDMSPQEREESLFQVLCDEDLGDAVCTAVAEIESVDSLEVVTLAEAIDLYTADGAPPSYDVWLTLDTMPGVLDAAREQAGLQPLSDPDAVVEVGSSGLSLLAYEDGALQCPDAAWQCIAEGSADARVGVPDSRTSGGLVVAGAAFAALGEDVAGRGIGALEGETDDLLDGLSRRADGTLDDQQAAIATQRGRYDGIVTTAGWAQRRISTNPVAGLAATEVAPAATVGVVLAGLGIQAVDAIDALREGVTGQTVREALAEAGWGGDPARSSGLPEPDVIYALREELG